MQIVATVGLAQNFGAVKALTTSGIRFAHEDALNQYLEFLKSNYAADRKAAAEYFQDKEFPTVPFAPISSKTTMGKTPKPSTNGENGKLLITGEYLVLDGALPCTTCFIWTKPRIRLQRSK